MMRKVVGWLVLAFLAYYLVTNPHSAGHGVRLVVTGIGSFFAALAGGAS